MSEKKKLVEVENLRKYFPVKSGFMKKNYVQAVEDASFSIYKGETLGPVSYTHLDVYKRQDLWSQTGRISGRRARLLSW